MFTQVLFSLNTTDRGSPSIFPEQAGLCGEPPGENRMEPAQALSLGRWLPLVSKTENCVVSSGVRRASLTEPEKHLNSSLRC